MKLSNEKLTGMCEYFNDFNYVVNPELLLQRQAS